jgi:Myb/SANT-like DNA-binding domain
MAKRQPNFSLEETNVLLGEIEKKGKVLFGNFGPALSSAMKDKGWEEVASNVSAVSGVRRSTSEIRKKWAVIKSAAKSKASAINRDRMRRPTDGGPSVEGMLSTDRS